MEAYAAHTTNYNTHLQLLNKQKNEPHKRAYHSKNGGLGKKKSGEWARSTRVKGNGQPEAVFFFFFLCLSMQRLEVRYVYTTTPLFVEFMQIELLKTCIIFEKVYNLQN